MDDHGRPFGKSDLRRGGGGGPATDGTLTEHGWKEKDEAAVKFRDYQREIFLDHKSGIVVLHWARQIGKSFTLAAWAVYRLLTRPGRLVTVLSNSRENGAEFVAKCAEICALNGARFVSIERGPELDYQSMRMEVRIRVKGKVGRIKVLAANPRTARGFSGDLILDEFAFHEDSSAIWAAAEPILASNPDFLCRIASTGNGQHNMFYRMAECGAVNPEWGIRKSEVGFWVSRVTRRMAFKQGAQIYDSQTRKPITPEAARAQALDKRTYDQNYECSFGDENLALLSQELISAAEREGVGMICEQRWSHEALALMAAAAGPLYLGFDVGRKVDLSVITVLEKVNDDLLARGILRMRDIRLPEQELQLGEVCRLAKFRGGAIDMTGLGLGLFEYAQAKHGSRIRGINFATTVPVTRAIQGEGRKQETVRVTEAMAVELLRVYEDRRIQHPGNGELRDDLRKAERVTSPGGRVSVAATRDEAGHADHFWSLALAVEAARKTATFGIEIIPRRRDPKYSC